MEILSDRKTLVDFVQRNKEMGKKIGFAPTMGALHAGHLSLYAIAREENDLVISSIFVNPTQFNNQEDLVKYPRTIEKDIELLRATNNVDAVYVPSVEDIYPNGAESKKYDFDGLEDEMEGSSRPGHFDGVGTVVEELFRQVQPNNAYFGEKDFQQLQIIKKLVEKTKLPIKIHGASIVREESGLALSSRNQRLTPEGKNSAKVIYKVLQDVKEWIKSETIGDIKNKVTEIFDEIPGYELEYFLIADEKTLKESEVIEDGKTYRAFIVVHVDHVRLIDNLRVI